MHTAECLIKKILITDAPALDPVSVYIEDLCKGAGQITISCYGNSWTAYWGNMGKDVATFFILSGDDYLVRCLSSVRPTAMKKQPLELSSDAYLLRIIRAVKQGLKDLAELKETAASVGIPRPTISIEDLRALGYELEQPKI